MRPSSIIGVVILGIGAAGVAVGLHAQQRPSDAAPTPASASLPAAEQASSPASVPPLAGRAPGEVSEEVIGYVKKVCQILKRDPLTAQELLEALGLPRKPDGSCADYCLQPPSPTFSWVGVSDWHDGSLYSVHIDLSRPSPMIVRPLRHAFGPYDSNVHAHSLTAGLRFVKMWEDPAPIQCDIVVTVNPVKGFDQLDEAEVSQITILRVDNTEELEE